MFGWPISHPPAHNLSSGDSVSTFTWPCLPPVFSDPPEHEIVFKDSRHILQETFVDGVYVPNDFGSGRDKTKIKILTGPNASGKSVYLCQVSF